MIDTKFPLGSFDLQMCLYHIVKAWRAKSFDDITMLIVQRALPLIFICGFGAKMLF